MVRIVLGFAFIPLYLGWLVYRMFIKKDIRQHMNDLYGLSFFIAVWLIIFYFLFRK